MAEHHAPIVENTLLQRPLGDDAEILVALVGTNPVAQRVQDLLFSFEQLHEFPSWWIRQPEIPFKRLCWRIVFSISINLSCFSCRLQRLT
jgi:hypothetical protein